MVAVIVVYSVINFVIQSIIQPRVVGDAVGLSPTLDVPVPGLLDLGRRAARRPPGGPAQPAHQGAARRGGPEHAVGAAPDRGQAGDPRLPEPEPGPTGRIAPARRTRDEPGWTRPGALLPGGALTTPSGAEASGSSTADARPAPSAGRAAAPDGLAARPVARADCAPGAARPRPYRGLRPVDDDRGPVLHLGAPGPHPDRHPGLATATGSPTRSTCRNSPGKVLEGAVDGGGAAFGIVGALIVLVSATSLSRALTRAFAAIWGLPRPATILSSAWRWLAVVLVFALSLVIVRRGQWRPRAPPSGLWPWVCRACDVAVAAFVPWALLASTVRPRLLVTGALLFALLMITVRPATQAWLPGRSRRAPTTTAPSASRSRTWPGCTSRRGSSWPPRSWVT